MQNVLIDTGFWYALFDKQDQYHNKALEILEVIALQNCLILPFPTLYETLNTSFIKNHKLNFDIFIKTHQNIIISDTKYTNKALEETLKISNYKYSLVDMVLRMMILDVNLSINGLVTFNEGDFTDVCQQRNIPILS
jgi:predicted nucleic acid-binding protein